MGALDIEGIDEGHVLLPGTHSKLARVQQGKLTEFNTFMTGELFSLLEKHSIPGRNRPLPQVASSEAFMAGVRGAVNESCLSRVLFSARTLTLTGELEEHQVSSYLSGLMIGHEVRALKAMGVQFLVIVGSSRLGELYRMALDSQSVSSCIIEGDQAFIKRNSGDTPIVAPVIIKCV